MNTNFLLIILIHKSPCNNIYRKKCVYKQAHSCFFRYTSESYATEVANEKFMGILRIESEISLDSRILMKLRLKSSPQPFESRKSSKIFPSMSIRFALNINCNKRRSSVEIVTVQSSLSFHFHPNRSMTVVSRLMVSSHFVWTKNRVIRFTSFWNGLTPCWVDPWVSCVQSSKSDKSAGCEKQ